MAHRLVCLEQRGIKQIGTLSSVHAAHKISHATFYKLLGNSLPHVWSALVLTSVSLHRKRRLKHLIKHSIHISVYHTQRGPHT